MVLIKFGQPLINLGIQKNFIPNTFLVPTSPFHIHVPLRDIHTNRIVLTCGWGEKTLQVPSKAGKKLI